MNKTRDRILFATNWTGNMARGCPLSLAQEFLNLIASEYSLYVSRKGYEKPAFLDIFDYAVDGEYDFIVYSDADNFIISKENLFLELKDFIDSGALFSGCSEGGQLSMRRHNPWSVNPFLLFVNVKKIRKYRGANRQWYFGENRVLTKDMVPLLTRQSYLSVVSAYEEWRKGKLEYKGMPFKADIRDMRFQRYNDIFLGSQSTGKDSIRFMYACDYVCKEDPKGISSAVFHFPEGSKRDFSDVSKMIAIHTWYSRAFLGKGGNEEFHKNRIERIAAFARDTFFQNNKCLVGEK